MASRILACSNCFAERTEIRRHFPCQRTTVLPAPGRGLKRLLQQLNNHRGMLEGDRSNSLFRNGIANRVKCFERRGLGGSKGGTGKHLACRIDSNTGSVKN